MRSTSQDLKLGSQKSTMNELLIMNYHRLIKYKSDPGVNKLKDVDLSMLPQLGLFVLSHSKRNMKTF